MSNSEHMKDLKERVFNEFREEFKENLLKEKRPIFRGDYFRDSDEDYGIPIVGRPAAAVANVDYEKLGVDMLTAAGMVGEYSIEAGRAIANSLTDGYRASVPKFMGGKGDEYFRKSQLISKILFGKMPEEPTAGNWRLLFNLTEKTKFIEKDKKLYFPAEIPVSVARWARSRSTLRGPGSEVGRRNDPRVIKLTDEEVLYLKNGGRIFYLQGQRNPIKYFPPKEDKPSAFVEWWNSFRKEKKKKKSPRFEPYEPPGMLDKIGFMVGIGKDLRAEFDKQFNSKQTAEKEIYNNIAGLYTQKLTDKQYIERAKNIQKELRKLGNELTDTNEDPNVGVLSQELFLALKKAKKQGAKSFVKLVDANKKVIKKKIEAAWRRSGLPGPAFIMQFSELVRDAYRIAKSMLALSGGGKRLLSWDEIFSSASARIATMPPKVLAIFKKLLNIANAPIKEETTKKSPLNLGLGVEGKVVFLLKRHLSADEIGTLRLYFRSSGMKSKKWTENFAAAWRRFKLESTDKMSISQIEDRIFYGRKPKRTSKPKKTPGQGSNRGAATPQLPISPLPPVDSKDVILQPGDRSVTTSKGSDKEKDRGVPQNLDQTAGGRAELEKERRRKAAAAKKAKGSKGSEKKKKINVKKIAFIGDSIMLGTLRATSKIEGIEYVSLAKRGASIGKIRKSINNIPEDAKIVVVNGGINNYPGFSEEGAIVYKDESNKTKAREGGAKVMYVVEQWQIIINNLLKKNKIVIILPMTNVNKRRLNSKRKAMFIKMGKTSWKYKNLKASGERIMTFASARFGINNFLRRQDKAKREIYMPIELRKDDAEIHNPDGKDGLHFTDQGYKRIAVQLEKQIREIISSPDSLEEAKIDESGAEIVLDAVNSAISELPMGHKWRNHEFAKQILSQTVEILGQSQDFDQEEVENIVNKLTGGISVL